MKLVEWIKQELGLEPIGESRVDAKPLYQTDDEWKRSVVYSLLGRSDDRPVTLEEIRAIWAAFDRTVWVTQDGYKVDLGGSLVYPFLEKNPRYRFETKCRVIPSSAPGIQTMLNVLKKAKELGWTLLKVASSTQIPIRAENDLGDVFLSDLPYDFLKQRLGNQADDYLRAGTMADIWFRDNKPNPDVEYRLTGPQLWSLSYGDGEIKGTVEYLFLSDEDIETLWRLANQWAFDLRTKSSWVVIRPGLEICVSDPAVANMKKRLTLKLWFTVLVNQALKVADIRLQN